VASVSVQIVEAPTASSDGFGDSNFSEKADLESGGGPVTDKNPAQVCDSRQDLVT